MPERSFSSIDVPKSIGVGSIPTLTQSTLSIDVPTDISIDTLSNVYLTLSVTPPSDGSKNLNIFVGPDTITELDNITCLHNSYHGNLYLVDITYPTNREVYAYPLSNWVSLIKNSSTINWVLSIYNWSDFTGVLNSWSMTYYYGPDVSIPAQPLNPVVRGVGKYYGTGSGFTRTIDYVRKIATCAVGMVDVPIPILSGISKVGNAMAVFENNDAEGEVSVALYKVGSSGLITKLFESALTVPLGFYSFFLPVYNDLLTAGEHLFYTVESTDITNAHLTIQTALMGV